MNSLNHELTKLLNLDLDKLKETQLNYWSNACGGKKENIVIVGSGELGQHVLLGLRQAGIEPLCFVDNNPKLHGTKINDVPVFSASDAAQKWRNVAVFVLAIFNTSFLRNQLSSLQINTIVPYAWLFSAYPNHFLPFNCLDSADIIWSEREEVEKAFGLMANQEMQRIYIDQLRLRLFFDFDGVLRPQTAELKFSEYFPSDIYTYSASEVLYDCGAFDGDTVRRFIKKVGSKFKNIVCFEPDLKNREMLNLWLNGLPSNESEKILVEPSATGDCDGYIKFSSTGTVRSSAEQDEGAITKVVTINSMAQKITPTLIKMDIEGAELSAIAGASDVIAINSPVLAICLYHKSNHLWQVPLSIHNLNKDYKFYIRAHAEDCWDVTCYAVPSTRLLPH